MIDRITSSDSAGQEGLGQRALRAVALVAFGKGVEKLVSFTTTILLARLLMPADYGVMAMAMMLIGFVWFLNEFGLGVAIVQKKALSSEELDGALWISLVLNGLLFLACYPLGQAGAAFLESPVLAQLVPVLGTGFIVVGVGTVSDSLLRRDMRFRPITVLNVLSTLAHSVVTLSLAYFGLGVWALVIGYLVKNFVKAAGLWIVADWRPSALRGVRRALPLVSYGMQVTYSRILSFATDNLDKLIIGRLLGDAKLGLYAMAMALASMTSAHITSVVVHVSAPLFAKLQDDSEALSRALSQWSKGVAYLAFPMLGGLFAVADELVPVVLGEQWLELTVPFQILCLIGLLRSLAPIVSVMLIATGHAKTVTWYTAVLAILVPLAVLAGVYWYGVTGAALGWALIFPIPYGLLLVLAKRRLQISLWPYFNGLLAVLLGTALMIVSVILVGLSMQGMAMPLVLLVKIVVGLLTYLIWLVYLSRTALREFHEVLIGLGVAPERLKMWPFKRLQISRDLAGR